MPAPIIAAYDPVVEDRAPVELALAVASLTGASVIVASVRPSPYVGGWADLYVADTLPDTTIEPALLRLRAEYPVTTRIVTDASVPRALHALASNEAASMIVVGSTRRGPTGRVLPGSTAERLLHGAPCPVALAPHGYVRTPVDTIAVGFVDSPEGHAALTIAHTLAGAVGARLRVIAALSPSSALDTPSAESTAPPRGLALEGRHRASVEAALSAALDAFPAAGVEIERDLHVDDPADVLLAVSEHVGLLVCGSRGYGPLRSVLLGGVSRRLVDGAHCPVLVLPRDAGSALNDLVHRAPGGVTWLAPTPSPEAGSAARR
jgi:nucleotide-binding universal stress UspA family protein